MSNYMRRLPLLRRPAQVADPGEMVDLRVEDGSWREGFFGALCAPSPAETGEVLIWVCTEDEYSEARWEDRRAVGMRWPAKRMRVSPFPTPGACPTGTGDRGVECGLMKRGASHRWPPGYRAVPGPTHMSVLDSNLLPFGGILAVEGQ
jgi:hypothetical protein